MPIHSRTVYGCFCAMMATVSSCNREPAAHKGCSIYFTENVGQPLVQTWRTQCSRFRQKRIRSQWRSIGLTPLTCPGTIREVWHPKFSSSPLPVHYAQAPSPSTNKSPAQKESTIHICGADPRIHLRPERSILFVHSFNKPLLNPYYVLVGKDAIINNDE